MKILFLTTHFYFPQRAGGSESSIHNLCQLLSRKGIPSQCEEAWGRVATECHINGIPVIANRIGGLPESVGSGGILINHQDFNINNWDDALKLLWHDESNYSLYSKRASDYGNREEIQPDYLIDKLVSAIHI